VQPSIATHLLGGAGPALAGLDGGLLELGAVLSARVVDVRAGHAWLALGGGRVMVATPAPLVVGQEVRVQVVRAPSGQRVLQLVDGAAPAGPSLAAPPRSASTPLSALAAGPSLAARPAAAGGNLALPAAEPIGPAQAPAPANAAPGSPAAVGRSPARGADPPPAGRTAVAPGAASLPSLVPALRGTSPTASLPPGSSPAGAPARPDGGAWPTVPDARLAGGPLGAREPAGAPWRDALAALDRLAAQGATAAPAAQLAAEALRAWQAESLEAPALARWLRRVVYEVAVPLEAKLAADSAGTGTPWPDAPPDGPARSEAPIGTAGGLAEAPLAAIPRPVAREAAPAARASPPPDDVAAPPELSADDARGRLALLRAGTSDDEARAAFDRLAAQLVGDQTRNALAPAAAGWCFTLPSPALHPQAPLELRVPSRPAEHGGPEPGVQHAVQLRLALPELGELVVELQTTGEQAHCRILTSSPFVAALFDATAPELVHALARAGYPRAAVETGVRPPARGESARAEPTARLDVRA
jgi:hypothetical protein